MTSKRGIQLRRCSQCGKTGHNRSKCNSIDGQKEKVVKNSNLSVKNKLSKVPKTNLQSGKSVFVAVNPTHYQSAHVVDLTHKKKENLWKDSPIYSENFVHSLVKPKTANFAQLVREHNQKLKINSVLQPGENKKLKSTVQDSEYDLLNILAEQKNRKQKKRKNNLPKLQLPNFDLSYRLAYFKKELNLKVEIFKGIINKRFLVIKNKFVLKKFVYAVLIIAILAALPFPAIGYYNDIKNTSNKVVEASTNAFLSLQSSTVAAMNSDIKQAEFDLNQALNSFGEATSILDKEHVALLYVAKMLPVVGTQIDSRQHLLTAGHHLALGNTYLVKGVEESEKEDVGSFTNKLSILSRHLKSSIPQYEEALNDLTAIDPKSVPLEYQQSFADFKLLFLAFINDMKNLVDLSGSIQSVFGSQELRRYLVVFQNNNEIRPSGGFIGSFAVLDIQKGKIVNMDIPGGGSYDLQGQLDTFLKPPLPLQLVNSRWEFQDANWFPDFPTTAQKLEWFYQHSRFSTVDGVIAVNATVLERFLGVVGPVIDNQGTEINQVNAINNIQYQTEVSYDKNTNQPKKVIADLASQFISEIGSLDKVKVIRLLSELYEAMQQKEIQIYFNDKQVEEKFASYGWTGSLEKTNSNQDFLMVVNTNMQGQKSDAKIEQKIEHQVEVKEDGSVIDTVVVHRAHSGEPGELFYGVSNVNYLRVYVPQGSELLEAGGFTFPPESAFHVPENNYIDDQYLMNVEKEVSIHTGTGTRITEEFGKTVFGNWVITPAGSTTDVYFVYKLPFKVFDSTIHETQTVLASLKNVLGVNSGIGSSYSLLTQKQSGINSYFSSTVIYPSNWYPVWKSTEGIVLGKNGTRIDVKLDRDQFYGVVMKKIN